VYVLTYDESGGFFDHVAPPQLDAYGLGPPGTDLGHLATGQARPPGEPTRYEHSSTLKLIEAAFGLPTLASLNHTFDTQTPGGKDNAAASGRRTGPPAPPRDGLSSIGTMLECFQF
jgi:phospholipase C